MRNPEFWRGTRVLVCASVALLATSLALSARAAVDGDAVASGEALALTCPGCVNTAANGAGPLVSSVLPSSRSVQVGQTATAFATIINAGSLNGTGCRIAPLTQLQGTFFYQRTNPATNAPVGAANTPVAINANAAQSFVFGVTPTGPIAETDVQFVYVCDNSDAAQVLIGVNTLLFSASATPVPDIITLAATLTGIVEIPKGNEYGFFAAATINIGVSGNLVAEAQVGTGGQVVDEIVICQTNQQGGCLSPPVPNSIPVTIAAGATPTFAVFIRSLALIPTDFGKNRVFLRFRENGTTRGATSVAFRKLLAITSGAPPGGTVNTPYSFSYSANGTVVPTYNVTGGALPPGLQLSINGAIGGKPTTAGTYAGVVTASNGTPPDATQPFSIIVVPAPVPPTITSSPPPGGVVNQAYSFSYAATGTAPITYSVSSGALPPGLQLSSSGALSGPPTAAGTYTGVVTASNGTSPAATQAFSIVVAAAQVAPTITNSAPPGGTAGAAYNFTYTASGTTPITYSVTSGALPPPLQLSSGGTISGTPSTKGTFAGVVTASNGTLPKATQAFSIVIAAAPVPPTITSGPPPGGTTGVAYNFSYTATGTAPIIYSVTSGALPPPLQLSSNGVISGNPNAAGTYTGVVTASNGTLPKATQIFNIVISAASVAPTITSAAPPGGTVGIAYSFTYTATGSTPITYSVTNGALPPPLQLSSAGVITGKPNAAGTYTGVVTASNGTLPKATQNFNIVIAGAPPIITSGAPPDGTVGAAYSFTYTATGSAPITYSVTSGALPPPLQLSSNGVISGTPGTKGTFSATVTASNGTLPKATQSFNILIQVSYKNNIVPIWSRIAGGDPATHNCSGCHENRLANYAKVLTYVNSGKLPCKITTFGGCTHSGGSGPKPLFQSETNLINEWINQGAQNN